MVNQRPLDRRRRQWGRWHLRRGWGGGHPQAIAASRRRAATSAGTERLRRFIAASL